MLAKGKERGYITYDELNAALPPEEYSSEQIEDTMSAISEMGINIVEADEVEEAAEKEDEAKKPKAAAISTTMPAAPTIRCVCICAKWARSSCCRARAKSPSPSASRPGAKC